MILGLSIYLVNVNCHITCEFFPNIFQKKKKRNLNYANIVVFISHFPFRFYFLVLPPVRLRKCRPLPSLCSRIWVYRWIVTLASNPELDKQVSQRWRRNVISNLFMALPPCGWLSPLPTFRRLFLIPRGDTVQTILSHSEHTEALSFPLNLNHFKTFLLLLKTLMDY